MKVEILIGFFLICISCRGELFVSPGVSSNAFEETSQVRSLAALIQVVNQLQHYVIAKDLASIHNEDVILGVCLPPMIQRLDIVSYSERDDFRSDLAEFARRVADLHLAGDLGQQTKAETQLKAVLEAFQNV
jgi:hypothetical protein